MPAFEGSVIFGKEHTSPALFHHDILMITPYTLAAITSRLLTPLGGGAIQLFTREETI
jgi:hypothetical protein